MDRIEFNLQTGERKTIALTPEEEAEALARTQDETDAAAAAASPEQLEADCQGFVQGNGQKIDLRRLIKAIVVSNLAFRLGKAPGQITAEELLAERNRIANIYKAL